MWPKVEYCEIRFHKGKYWFFGYNFARGTSGHAPLWNSFVKLYGIAYALNIFSVPQGPDRFSDLHRSIIGMIEMGTKSAFFTSFIEPLAMLILSDQKWDTSQLEKVSQQKLRALLLEIRLLKEQVRLSSEIYSDKKWK